MPDTSITLAGPVAIVELDVAILAGQLAPSSIAQYRADWAAYGAWCLGAALSPYAAPSLARYRAALASTTTLAPATINRRLAAVKRVVAEGAEQGYLPAAVAAEFKLLKGVQAKALKGRGRAHARTRISPADMRRLIEAPDRATLRGARDAALLACLATSALRIGEACVLRLTDIRPAGGGYLISVLGKGKAEIMDAPLGGEAHGLIMAWVELRNTQSTIHNAEYVFTGFAGRGRLTAEPLSEPGAWAIVTGYAKQCGLEHVTPHSFRRFVGTQLARQDIRLAQKALRHTNIATTAKHYVLDDLAVGVTDNLY